MSVMADRHSKTTVVSSPHTVGSRWLAVLEAFIALQAVYGGISLIADTWHLDSDWLKHLPLMDDWVLPGVFLILVIAVPMAAAAFLEWTHHPKSLVVSLVAGLVLVGWIAAQLLLMPTMHLWLQPVCAILGLAITTSAVVRLRAGRNTAKGAA